MPGKPDTFEEMVDKAAVAVPAYAIAGMAFAAFYMVKYGWRFLVFTGLWPFATVLAIFSITGSMDYLTWPAFFSLVFAPVWTGRNLLVTAHPTPIEVTD